MDIAQICEVRPTVALRNPPVLRQAYTRELVAAGAVRGVADTAPDILSRGVMLKQASNGINWTVDDSHIASPEYWPGVAALRRAQHAHGLVIEAHPSIHSFPWDAPPNIANRHVLRHLKRQPYCKAKVELGTALTGEVCYRSCKHARTGAIGTQRLLTRLRNSCGVTTMRWRSIKYGSIILWYSNSSIYSSWVGNSTTAFRRLYVCGSHKETLEHIFWTCPVAQGC